MQQLKRTAFAASIVAIFIASALTVQTAQAQKSETPIPTRQTDTATAVQPQVEQLLLVIGENQHGQVSKEEFLQLMQAAFDKIDKDASGQVKCTDLEKSGVGVVPAAKMGR